MDAEHTISDSQSVEDMVRELSVTVSELQAENEELRSRINELESQPRIEWDDQPPSAIKIYHPEEGFPFPLGAQATQNLPPEFEEEDLTKIQDDIEKLKRGEVSGADLLGGAEPELPIEADLARAQNDLGDDLTANERRAVQIFRKFDSRHESWSGTLTLNSAKVKTILKEDGNETDPNPNTVKRAMRMLAKKTSTAETGDRDPQDKDQNLLWVAKGDKRLHLRANKSEWIEYTQEVEERYAP